VTYTALWQAYVEDQTTEQLLHQLASQFETEQVQINKGSILSALPELEKGEISPLLILECTNLEKSLEVFRQLDEICYQNTRIIAIGKENDVAYRMALAEYGIDSYLTLPIDQEQLTQAVTSAAVSIRYPAKNQTIMVLGTRGSLGTTTLATNLACIIAKKFKSTTCLMDFDFYFGTVTFNLNQTPNHGLMTALEQSLTLSLSELLQLTQDYEQLIQTLTADLPLTYKPNIPQQQSALQKLMDLTGQHFQSLVVDVGSLSHPEPRAHDLSDLLVHASHFIVVTGQNLLGLRDCERVLNYLKEIKPETAVTVMSNAWHPLYQSEQSVKEFQNNLKQEVTELPYIKSANQDFKQNKLLAISKPHHAYCKALEQLADLFQLTQQAAKPISTWRKLWGV